MQGKEFHCKLIRYLLSKVEDQMMNFLHKILFFNDEEVFICPGMLADIISQFMESSNTNALIKIQVTVHVTNLMDSALTSTGLSFCLFVAEKPVTD